MRTSQKNVIIALLMMVFCGIFSALYSRYLALPKVSDSQAELRIELQYVPAANKCSRKQ